MASSFVHLHLHTQFSLLDGANQIDPLVQQIKSFNQPAVAMTDHGNMFGAIEFYRKAKEAGVKPIIGCEAYMALGGDQPKKIRESGKTANNNLFRLPRIRPATKIWLNLSVTRYLKGYNTRLR